MGNFSKLTLILAMVFGVSYAQTTSAEGESLADSENKISLSISFEEALTNRILKSHDVDLTSWIITNSSDQTQLKSGVGESLFQFVFEEPGSYEIDFTIESHEHTDGCSHNDVPSKVYLNVNPSSINYLLEDVVLSNEIVGEESAEGISLAVPVEVKNFNNEVVTIPSLVYASGVNTTIQGSVDENQQLLTTGNHTLIYRLTGSAVKDTYISFDFEDANGNMQTYYHLQKIK